jgi:hypothetical protein
VTPFIVTGAVVIRFPVELPETVTEAVFVKPAGADPGGKL